MNNTLDKYFWAHECFSKDFRYALGFIHFHKSVKICSDCLAPNLKNLPKFKRYIRKLRHHQQEININSLVDNENRDFPRLHNVFMSV